jgi:hypothetical protein
VSIILKEYSMKRSPLIGRLSLVLVLALALTGCDRGPKLYPVSGTVSFKGQDIKFGTISFRAANGDSGAAQIVDGKYSIPAEAGLVAGDYKVAISFPDPKIPIPTGAEPPGAVLPSREMLPKKYNDESELTAQVKAAGSNDISFQLK